MENCREVTYKSLAQWAYPDEVELHFSQRRKPSDNPFIQAFNGKFKYSCLNENRFFSPQDAEAKWKLGENSTIGKGPTARRGTCPTWFAVLTETAD